MTVKLLRPDPNWRDPNGWLSLQPDSSDGTPVGDVIVIGLGAAGLTCCLELARAGLRVVGLEASTVGAGASGRNGGFLLAGLALFHHDAVTQLGRERADTWYQATLDELDRTFAEEPSARRTGSLRLAGPDPGEAADIHAHGKALEEAGFPVEAHDGPHGVGIRIPADGQYEPLERCHRLAMAARDAGARFVKTRIRDIEPGHVVDVEGWGFDAPTIVVAIDGGLHLLAPQVGVRTARLQMLATEPVPLGTIEQPIYRRYGLDWVRQANDGAIHVGGGRDREGEAAWTLDATPTDAVQAHLDALLDDLGITAPVARRWAAHSAWTPDRLPICTTVMAGVHVIGGYSGHGNLIGPILGRHVARAVANGDTQVSLPY